MISFIVTSIFVLLYCVMIVVFWKRATDAFDLEENGMSYWNLFCSAASGAGLALMIL